MNPQTLGAYFHKFFSDLQNAWLYLIPILKDSLSGYFGGVLTALTIFAVQDWWQKRRLKRLLIEADKKQLSNFREELLKSLKYSPEEAAALKDNPQVTIEELARQRSVQITKRTTTRLSVVLFLVFVGNTAFTAITRGQLNGPQTASPSGEVTVLQPSDQDTIKVDDPTVEYSTPTINQPTTALFAGNLDLEGKADPGNDLQLVINGEVHGITNANANNRWKYQTSLSNAGEYEITVKTLDAAGNVVNSSESKLLTVHAKPLFPVLIRLDESTSCFDVFPKVVQGKIPSDCSDMNSNWMCYGSYGVSITPVEFRFHDIRDRRPLSAIDEIEIDGNGSIYMNLHVSYETNPITIVAIAVSEEEAQQIKDSSCETLPLPVMLHTTDSSNGYIEINGVRAFELR
ncbi:MAG: Ig-like domain-containing protein [Chloroflexota bacterium]